MDNFLTSPQKSNSFDTINKVQPEECETSDEEPEVKEADENFNEGIKVMFEEEQWNIALNTLEITSHLLPSSDNLEIVVYQILMSLKKPLDVSRAYGYVMHVLQGFPPTFKRKNYYYKALFSNRQNQSTYDFICKPLNCCLEGNCSSDELESTCDKNCLWYLKYIVAVLKENHRKTIMMRNKKKQSLICEIFWPLGKVESFNENIRDLINKISILFSLGDLNEKQDLFEIFQDLLSMVVETALINSSFDEVEIVIGSFCQTSSLTQIIKEEICSICMHVTNDLNKLDLFLTFIEPAWLKILVAESFINLIVQVPVRYEENLCLRKIIVKYMFQTQSENIEMEEEEEENLSFSKDKKDKKISHSKVKNKRPAKSNLLKKNNSSADLYSLHGACRNNAVFTLDELMDSIKDFSTIDLKDSNGKTPLHHACAVNSFQCARTFLNRMEILIQNDHDKFINEVFVQDDDGQTPLHVCVEQDNHEIAEIILNHKVTSLLHIKDNNGNTPFDLIRSAKMKELLTKAESLNNLMPDLLSVVKNASLISCQTFTKNEVHLLCLLTVLMNYINFFHLFKLKQAKLKSETFDTKVKNHLFSHFNHTATDNTIEQFCDDCNVLSELEVLLNHFCDRLIAENEFLKSSIHFRHIKIFASSL